MSDAPPQPVPVTPADACRPAGLALAAAADELRGLAVGIHLGHPLPPELARRGDLVSAGALYGAAEWLDAKAGLYGVDPAELAAEPVGFDDALPAWMLPGYRPITPQDVLKDVRDA